MKIITLSENYAKDRGILAEHGLSIYIETFNSDGTIKRRVLLTPDKVTFLFTMLRN